MDELIVTADHDVGNVVSVSPPKENRQIESPDVVAKILVKLAESQETLAERFRGNERSECKVHAPRKFGGEMEKFECKKFEVPLIVN